LKAEVGCVFRIFQRCYMGVLETPHDLELLEVYYSADFVVAKGMENAETLTEMGLKTPHLLPLRAKCKNVASYLRVKRRV